MFVHIDPSYVPFKEIYLEFNLDNMFYRETSELKSYKSANFGVIEPNDIPVFSFRCKSPFNKMEEKEFKKNEGSNFKRAFA